MDSITATTLTARSSIDPIDPSLTSFYVHEYTVGNCFAFGTLTLIVYNALTTLDKEVHFFWRKPITFVGLIFFLNRYVGLIAAVSNIILGGFHVTRATCQVAVWIYGLSSSLSILLIDYILLLRVLALYQRNNKLALVLRVLFFLEIISLVGITSYLASSTDPTPGSLPVGIVLCTDDNGLPPILGALLLGIPLVYGSILMFLALYQAGRVWNETHGIQGVDLVRVLIQDQAIYFIMVLFCTVANIIAAASPISPFSSYVLEAAGSPTFLCVVGNHLLIHLKEAVEEGRNEGTSYKMKTISAMGFEQDESAALDIEMRYATASSLRGGAGAESQVS